jgi:ABC-type nickel/cobalt efflux system permease component RcnA
MFGLDDWIAGLGGTELMAFVVALLLGLRHATDPDHLTAVSTLFLSRERGGPRRATLLGLWWGLGHALTLIAFGVPVILFRRYLPEAVQRGAETAIGLVIAGLAVRLLLRWRRGYFHVHPHTHGGVRHAHPHAHEHAHGTVHLPEHTHGHAEGLGRSPLAAFGIGMIHGVGGSAGAGMLLVGAVPGQLEGVIALLIFALATAGSMALVSTVLGYALSSGVLRRRVNHLVPWFGCASLVFGLWYSLGSIPLSP